MTHSPQISPATPFHSLKPDCIFAILKHFLFGIRIPPKWSRQDWEFMARYASCLQFFEEDEEVYCGFSSDDNDEIDEEKEKQVTLAHMKDILRRCRCHEKNCFYFLNLRGSTLDNQIFTLMRGIKNLDISFTSGWTSEAFENLRGVQKLDLSDSPRKILNEEMFENLRGISELIISGCDDFVITPRILENLRGIKVLKVEEECYIPGLDDYLYDLDDSKKPTITADSEILDDAFKNLRGIRELDICSSRITEDCFKHLRGIQSLVMQGSHRVSVSTGSLSNLRGVKKLSIAEMKDNFTDESLRELRGVTDFEFSCYSRSFTQHGIANLRGVKKLTFYHRSDGSIRTALEELRGVEELSLSCEDLSDHITDKELANFVGLRELELAGYNLTSITQESLRYFKTMDTVTLDQCTLPPIDESQWKTAKGRVRMLEDPRNIEWDTLAAREYTAIAKGENYAQMMFGDAGLWR